MAGICRMCIKNPNENNCYKLADEANQERSAQFLREINVCLPELHLGLIKDPLICTACASVLHLAYNLKQKCLSNQLLIQNMLKSVDPPRDSCILAALVESSDNEAACESGGSTEVVEDQELDDKTVVSILLNEIDPQMVMDIKTSQSVSIKEESAVLQAEFSVQGFLSPCLRLERLPSHIVEAGTVRLSGSKALKNVGRPKKTTKQPSNAPKKPLKQYKSKTKLKCKLCSFSSWYQPNLMRHTKVLHTRKLALICGYKAGSERNLLIHGKSHRSKETETHKKTRTDVTISKKQLKGNKFRLEGPPKLMQAQESVLKLLKCSVCEFKARNKASLKYHQQKHADLPFGCIVCDYTTYSRNNVVIHMRRHNRPNSNLKRYSFVHSDEADSTNA